MPHNPLRQLHTLGQSVWLVDVQRALIDDGQLRNLIGEDCLRGITSSPAALEGAIAHGPAYDASIRGMAAHGQGSMAIYEALSQTDVQRAAEELRPVYESTEGCDGYACLEINPHLANDTRATIEEARRLWALIDRPNTMIKVPATRAGLPAIRQLIAEGINVNVTLLFDTARYREAAQAYIAGLEARASQGFSVRRVASVASFSVGRIDQLVDALLDALLARAGVMAAEMRLARGQVGIASAKCAYKAYREMFAAERFAPLAQQGACTQRLLWAATGGGLPAHHDVKYVEALIAAETVASLPLATLDAYRLHGNPKARLDIGAHGAAMLLASLERIGISLEHVAMQLEREGVEKAKGPFESMLVAISKAARLVSQAAVSTATA